MDPLCKRVRFSQMSTWDTLSDTTQMEGPPGHKETEKPNVSLDNHGSTVDVDRFDEEATSVPCPILSSWIPKNFSECCDVIQPAVPSTVPHLIKFQETVLPNFLNFKVLLEGACGTTLLEVTHRLVHNHPSAGHVHRVWAILSTDTSGYYYNVQVHLKSIKTGVVSSEQDFIELCNSLLWSKGFVFCPGIGYQFYKDNYVLFSHSFS